MERRLKALISGRVQGVSFRYYTQRKAVELGLVGWVRNEPDGTVRMVAEGSRAALEEMLEFVKEGPPHARVESCKYDWVEASGEFERFRITR